MGNLPYTILVWAPGILFAITLHEWAHGYAAFRYGDHTAARMGRLTLNPIPHIDPIMTLLVPGLLLASSLLTVGSPLIFGSAKPVPINPNHFHRQGVALRAALFWVAAAGPLSNFVLAGLCAGLLHGLLAVGLSSPVLILEMLLAAIKMNVVLAIFNLFPLPPLDGGRMATALLPPPLDRILESLERFGLAIVLLLAFSGLLDALIAPIMTATTRFFVGMAVPW
ncbi:MAG: site-2 protease family protein [Magnetococcales bacterium]|nr:site-2 protease family protein [Magnetococcales bacterium]